MNKLKNSWDLIIKISLYALVFLTPLFFLPWTNYQVAWNKHFLLVVLIVISFVAWLIKTIVRGEITYNKSYINVSLLALVVVTAISAFFSGARSLGFWGATGAEVDTFLSVISFSLLLLIIANTVISEKILSVIFFISSVIIVLVSLLQFLGLSIFPWSFASSTIFNTVGTTNALAIFLGFLFVVLFSFWHSQEEKKITIRHIGLIGLIGLIALTLIGIRFWLPFLGIALAMLILMAINKRFLAWPAVVLLISLFFIGGNFYQSLSFSFIPSFKLPLEVMPSLSSSWSIAKSTAQEGSKNFLLGSGPATFQYQYGLYRSTTLNSTDFWSVRFVQGVNALITHLVNLGVLGLIAWGLFLLFLLLRLIKVLLDRHSSFFNKAVALGLGYLILLLFFYPQNFVFYFFIFAFGGLLIKELDTEEVKISITNTPLRTFGFSLVLMVLIMLSVSFLYVEAQRYVGSVYFYSALQDFNITGNPEKVLPKLSTALDYDPRNDFYFQNVAQAYLLRVNAIVNQPTTKESLPQLQTQFSGNLGGAIEVAKKAVQINPRDSQNWLILGQVYETVILLVPGAADQAFEAYNQALKLEPNNPSIYLALGRSYMSNGDFLGKSNDRSARLKEYDAAANALEQAVLLKPNYSPAHFVLIQVYDRQGRDSKVTEESNLINQIAPNDPVSFYQLGVLHYRVGRIALAQTSLEKAVSLFNNYSNARYYLGTIYARNGQREKAIEQFSKILELNPDNQEVKDFLKNLRSAAMKNVVKEAKTPILKQEPKSKNENQVAQ